MATPCIGQPLREARGLLSCGDSASGPHDSCYRQPQLHNTLANQHIQNAPDSIQTCQNGACYNSTGAHHCLVWVQVVRVHCRHQLGPGHQCSHGVAQGSLDPAQQAYMARCKKTGCRDWLLLRETSDPNRNGDKQRTPNREHKAQGVYVVTLPRRCYCSRCVLAAHA